LVALLATASLGIQSCKKGENDPSLSLRSRKARLTGEWQLSAYEGTSESVSGSGSKITTTYSFDGAIEKVSQTTSFGSSSTTTTFENKYETSYVFNKDGSFKISYSNLDNNTRSESEGFWMFLEGNENADLKDKEAILLTYTKTTNTDKDGKVTTNSGKDLTNNSQTLVLDQLKNDEIIYKVNYQSINSSTSNNTTVSSTYTSTETSTLKKK